MFLVIALLDSASMLKRVLLFLPSLSCLFSCGARSMFGGARPAHDAGKLARVLDSTDEEMMRQFAEADQRRTEPDLGTHKHHQSALLPLSVRTLNTHHM
jgi:hypothetical protein